VYLLLVKGQGRTGGACIATCAVHVE